MIPQLDRAAPRDPRALRQAFSEFPSGVVAVCALMTGQPVGLSASSFTTVSLDPPLVSVCAANDSTTWPVLRRAGRLGLSVFAEGQAELCRQLSRKTGDRFTGVEWCVTATGAVFLPGSPLWLETAVHAEVPAGDHSIVLLEVEAVETAGGTSPLVFHRSTMRRLPAAPAGPGK